MHPRFVIITLITLFIIGKLDARNHIYNGPINEDIFDNINNFYENFTESSKEVNDLEEINDSKEDYRLPKTVVPDAYNLMIQMRDDYTYYGLTKINVTIEEKTDEIVLHQGNISLESITIIELKHDKKIAIDARYYNNVTEKLTIKLKEKLPKNLKVFIAIEYNGVISNNMIGFYKSSYFDKNDRLK